MGDLAVPARGVGRHGTGEGQALVPAMPVIRSYEQYQGEAYPALDGITPTIGWQWRTEKKGGPAFAVINRTLLGSYKVQQRFPLTEDGWASAWQALVRLSPGNAVKIEARLRARAVEDRVRERESGASETAELDARSLASLSEVALLGGYASGADMKVGERYWSFLTVKSRLWTLGALAW
jgi:hypothetical protein